MQWALSSVLGPGDPGAFLFTRGDGAAPGERFPGPADPGDFEAGAQTHSDHTGFMAVTSMLAFVRWNQGTSEKIGAIALVGHRIAAGQLRAPCSLACTCEFPPWQ